MEEFLNLADKVAIARGMARVYAEDVFRTQLRRDGAQAAGQTEVVTAEQNQLNNSNAYLQVATEAFSSAKAEAEAAGYEVHFNPDGAVILIPSGSQQEGNQE